MTGKQLVLDVLDGKKVERTPWVPYTGVQIASLKGYTAEEILKDGDKLLECLIESNMQYSPDGQPVVFDLQIEAEALGCDLLWAEKAPPTVSAHPLSSTKEINLEIPGPDAGRTPLVIDVMKRFKSEVGETTALYGLVCGPFTLASHLRGTDIFMDMYDDPDYVKRILGFCNEVAKAYADYYIDAGMDIIGAVDPLISQISPDSFKQFMSEPYSDFFAHIRKRGVKSSFFVCGDATKNLEVMSATQPDCLSIDENIDLVKAKEVTDSFGITISGNIQLTVVMLLGTQQDCQKSAIEKIDQMGNSGFILAPGCDMPFDVPKANVIGVAQAAQNYDATKKAIENYTPEALDLEVELPDYSNLDKPLIEVFTIDSATCAACGYMKAAADGMLEEFPGGVEIVERKITEMENIARCGKMGIANLPTIAINGVVKYISVIPNKQELKAAVSEVI